MAMIIGIIFTAMVLAFCLATGLISYSVYMCFKLHKSLQMKKLVKEKEELEKGKIIKNGGSFTEVEKEIKSQQETSLSKVSKAEIPKENIKLNNNVAYSHVSIPKNY